MPENPGPNNAQDKSAAIRQKLAAIWTQSIPIIQQRLAVLDSAAAANRNGPLPSALLEDAIGEAHKLAGSLGMFGHMKGSAIARDIELLLEAPTTPDPTQLSELTTQLRSSIPLD